MRPFLKPYDRQLINLMQSIRVLRKGLREAISEYQFAAQFGLSVALSASSVAMGFWQIRGRFCACRWMSESD